MLVCTIGFASIYGIRQDRWFSFHGLGSVRGKGRGNGASSARFVRGWLPVGLFLVLWVAFRGYLLVSTFLVR